MRRVEIDRAGLEHAYGPTVDVPGLPRDLESADAGGRERARDELVSSLCHRGTGYPASAPAVPHLARLALQPLRRAADGARRVAWAALPDDGGPHPDPAVRDAVRTLLMTAGWSADVNFASRKASKL